MQIYIYKAGRFQPIDIIRRCVKLSLRGDSQKESQPIPHKIAIAAVMLTALMPGSRSVKIVMSNAGSGSATRVIFLVIITGAGQIP